ERADAFKGEPWATGEKRARPRAEGPGARLHQWISFGSVRRNRRGRRAAGRGGRRRRRRGVRIGLALFERISTMVQPLTARLTPFAPRFHALALALHPLAAPLLPVRDALERVGGLHVALGAQLLGPLILGLCLLGQLLAALLAPLPPLLTALALALHPLGALLHSLRPIRARHRGDEHQCRHHSAPQCFHRVPLRVPAITREHRRR